MERVSYQSVRRVISKDEVQTHEFIVTFPSLEKMRRSDRVVTFEPTTNGFKVDPPIYSVTLQKIA